MSEPNYLNHFCACSIPPVNQQGSQIAVGKTRAAFLNEYRWNTGDIITIGFLEGDQDLRKRVIAAANTWLNYANLFFDFRNNGPTDIRISFQQGKGSNSVLGILCKQVAQPSPTMNFGSLNPASSDDELQRVVLHEFGHALGLIHEHQSPKGGIQWNHDAVKRDLSQPPYNWDDAKIEKNIYQYYSPQQLTASAVDLLSIMMYPIQKGWTNNGFSIGWNRQLSEMDKQMTRNYYLK
jgi:serralysin